MADLEEAFRRTLETLREDARQHVNSGVREPENLGVTGVSGVTTHKNNELAVTPFKNPGVTGVTGQGHGYTGYTLSRVGCNRETPNNINAVTPVTPVTPQKTAHLKNKNLVFTLCPRIVREPPFGSDGVPARYLSAWRALLAQCPPGVAPIVWEAAIFDCGPLFGDFGEALVRMGWPPGALFDVPHDDRPGGLAWFLEGETVRALGPERAFTETGRIFDRKRTSEDINYVNGHRVTGVKCIPTCARQRYPLDTDKYSLLQCITKLQCITNSCCRHVARSAAQCHRTYLAAKDRPAPKVTVDA